MKFDPNNTKEINRLKQVYVIGEQEKIIDVVYKHPAYLWVMFSVIIIVYILILLAGFIFASSFSDDKAGTYRIMTITAALLALLIALVMVTATYLYLQTKIIITNENLIQIIQRDLLHSKSSRIALTDIEGVYSDQMGYLATMFGYGKLTVETKGEQVNFVFLYCPRTKTVAKELIDAKERLITGVETYSQV